MSHTSRQCSIPSPRPRFQLTLLPLAALYLSTTLTSHAQLNPNLMKYACGPANRMFATLSPDSRFTDTTPGFDLIDSPGITGKSCTSAKPFFFSVPSPKAATASPSSSAVHKPRSPPCAPKAVASCSKKFPLNPTSR